MPPRSRKSPSAWNDRPNGYVSVKEAAIHLGVSSQRVQQLINEGRLRSQRTTGVSRNGFRDRVWVERSSILERHAQRAPSSGQRKTRPPADDQGSRERSDDGSGRSPELQAVERERDQWQAQAMRAKDGIALLTLAIDAMRDALRHKEAAEQHASTLRDEAQKTFDSLDRAIDYQNRALKQVWLPSDPSEI